MASYCVSFKGSDNVQLLMEGFGKKGPIIPWHSNKNIQATLSHRDLHELVLLSAGRFWAAAKGYKSLAFMVCQVDWCFDVHPRLYGCWHESTQAVHERAFGKFDACQI